MTDSKSRLAQRTLSIRNLRQITESEKEHARVVWKQVEKEYMIYGRNVFQLLFAEHPTYKRFFLDILGSEDHDPFKNPRFQKHMLQVLMPTIGGIIFNLDHPDAVHESLKRLGVGHKRKEIGLRRENVDTVLKTLKQNLKNFSPEQEMALSKILTILASIFGNGLEGKTS